MQKQEVGGNVWYIYKGVCYVYYGSILYVYTTGKSKGGEGCKEVLYAKGEDMM